MIAASKVYGVSLLQSNQMPKLILAHGIHLALFKNYVVNNLRVEKNEAMAQKKKIPPSPVLTHPVVNLVNIWRLITDLKRLHVMIAQFVCIQTKKISITYHFLFGFIYLACFLNQFNGVETHREDVNSLYVINQNINNTRQFGDDTNHCNVQFSALFKNYVVNNLRVEKNEAMAQKKKIPPSPVLTHPVVNLVNIWRLITDLKRLHVMIAQFVCIQTKKISITYHFLFGFIYLACFLNQFNGVETHREDVNSLYVINQNINNTRQFGDDTNHCNVQFSSTNKKEKINKLP